MRFTETDIGHHFDTVIGNLEDLQKRLDNMKNTLDIVEYALVAAAKLEESQARIAVLEAQANRRFRLWGRK